MKSVALTIAGSDPSGGAGIQADLKTFHQFGVYGEAVITLLTVQNTLRVSRVQLVSSRLIAEQLQAVLEDIPPLAAKTGALGSVAVVRTVAKAAAKFAFPLVVDPVMISKHGSPLLDDAACDAMIRYLLPHATLVTPNLPEAKALSGYPTGTMKERKEAAKRIAALGPESVLIKGGHGKGPAIDLLLHDGKFLEFKAPRFKTRHTHGTGCTYSAAITACLARGLGMVESILEAKGFITEAIRTNPGLGHGCGPVNHHAGIRR